MAFPFREDFNPGAGVLANPPWTQAATSTATLNYDGAGSGKASATDASDVFAYDNSNSYNADQFAEVKIAGGLAASNNYAEALVRASGTGASFQGYSFNTDGTTGALHTVISKWSAGAPTDIANFAATFTTGDVMRIEIRGSKLTVFKNGVSLGSFTDGTPLTGGAPGCGVFNQGANSVLLDNFVGGNLADTIYWTVGTWAPPGTPGPRDPLGFLLKPTFEYVETPPPPPPPAVVPAKPVVANKKRPPKKTIRTTLLQAKLARTATQAPKRPITVKTSTRRHKKLPEKILLTPRTGSTGAAPVARRAAITVVRRGKAKPKKRSVKYAKSPVQPPAAPSARAQKQPVVIRGKRRARKAGHAGLLVAKLSRTTALAAAKPVVVERKRKLARRGKTTLRQAPRQAAAIVTRQKQQQPLVVRGKRRHKKLLTASLLTAKVSRALAARPVKEPVVVPKKRRTQKRKPFHIAGAPRAAVVIVVGRPPKSITTKFAGKRRKTRGGARQLFLKKKRTPYITGVTRNSAGTPIGSCNVFVFRTADEVLVAQGVSDSVTGIYLLPVPSYTDNLFVVAYRADAPDIFGTTVNWLTGV